MGRSCSFLLLLFLLVPAPRTTVSLPRHRYSCGEVGMQLLVFPSHGRSVRFKVLDEFGTRFDVANCSICLHRLNSGEDGSVVFSSGYKGCHVLLQENHYVLRVQLEELLPSGIPVTSFEVNMTCPKPGGYEVLPNGNLERGRDNGVLVSHAGLLHHVSQSSLSLGSQLSSHTHSEQVHTVAHNEPSSVLPGISPHSNPVHPGLRPESGGIRPVSNIQGGFNIPGVQAPQPGGQTQPGLVAQNHLGWRHPGGQTWPGLHPGFGSRNPPSLVNSGSQTQPGLRPGSVSQNPPSSVHLGGQNQPGHLRPGSISQNPTSLVNSGSQTQPGLRPGFASPNHPSLVNSGSQTQPGLRPGFASPNHPSSVNSGSQTQPGFRPGFGSQNPPSLVNSGSQTQPGLRPGFASPNHPSSVNSGSQTQPGFHPGFGSQNPPSLVNSGSQNQPGFRPGFGSQNPPSLVNSGSQTQPGLRPGFASPNHPSSVNSRSQTQPGFRPGFGSQNTPSLVNSGSQNQPGLRPGFVLQNPSSSVYSGSQTRPGSVSQNPPSLVHPGGQTQPGLRPGTVSQTPPGFSPAGAHIPAGFLRPGTQPGIAPSGVQSNPQTGLPSHTGLVHPGYPSPALVHPGPVSWPGLISSGLQPGLLHPGINSQPGLLQPTALFYPSGGAGMQLTREQCQVPVGRMPCVAPQGRDGCIQVGCCYDDMDRTTPCYYGNTATVQCLREGQFILVVPRGTAAQPYNVDSVRLAGSQAGCEPFRVSDTFVMFRFPVTHCGTTLQVIEDRLIYENQLISTIDVQGSSRGFVTRDSVYILRARCIYNASDLLPLGMEVAVPTTATPLAMPGPLGLQLRIATDESYSSYHAVGDFPLVRVLRDPIFVEVRLLQKTDPNLVLVLHQCWASPGSNATAQPQWPILVDGCPFQGDNYRTRMVPVGPASPELPFPSHYQRFVISTFTFVEPPGMAVMEGEVYISCSASVCHLAQPEPCRPSCQLGATSRARRSPRNGRMVGGVGMVTSQGCVVFPKVSRRS